MPGKCAEKVASKIDRKDQRQISYLFRDHFAFLLGLQGVASCRASERPRLSPRRPDYSAPVILRGHVEPTLEAFCDRIHRTLKKDLKHALVWGSSVKHNPGIVGIKHMLADEDVVQIIKKT